MRVTFYEVFEEERSALEKFAPSSWRVEYCPLTIQEAGHAVPPCDVISIRTQSIIPDAWSPALRAILSRSAGFDHLLAYRARAGTRAALGHLFRYSGRAVAEHAAMMWLALLHRLPRQMRSIPSFQRDRLTGRECGGRTLAVVGVGDIGSHIVDIGRGLGMTVIGVDPVQRRADICYRDKADALAAADIVVCAMNLTEHNPGYFSSVVLAGLRPGALFVNVARGEFARSSDLLTALENGPLGGVGLDVVAAENLVAPAAREDREIDHPEYRAFRRLLERDDVILTPHNAFNTVEAVERKSEQSIRQLQHFFDTGTFHTFTDGNPT